MLHYFFIIYFCTCLILEVHDFYILIKIWKIIFFFRNKHTYIREREKYLLKKLIYIYIYIYMCVCVYVVCVCEGLSYLIYKFVLSQLSSDLNFFAPFEIELTFNNHLNPKPPNYDVLSNSKSRSAFFINILNYFLISFPYSIF